jgi:hypothetical protein
MAAAEKHSTSTGDFVTKDEAHEFTEALVQAAAGHEQTREGLVRIAAHGIQQGVPKALGMRDREWADSIGRITISAQNGRREIVAELTEEGMSTRQIGAALGVDQKTVVNDQHAEEISSAEDEDDPSEAEIPEAAEEVSSPAVDEKQQRKAEAAEETKTRRETSRTAPVLDDAFQLRIGDAREVLADVPNSSVPLILTDPPYGDEAEPLYEWLAEWSERVLIPGGSLIVYTGQSRLDRDMRIFGEKLRYWWLLSMLHTATQSLPGKFVRAEFKPVLWFVKSHRRGRALINDVLRPPKAQMNKDQHYWGQGEGGVQFLIENLTDPGEWILDPFAGTATWGHIAVASGRRWLGAEVESDEAVRSRGRIAA